MADTPDTPLPEFTKAVEGGSDEEPMAESNILSDQDGTKSMRPDVDDENLGAQSIALDSLENEPTEFMRGDIDVKEQMDRAANALDSSLHGWESQAYEDDPNGDLGASFRATPGGIEEVEMKTDQELAIKHHGGPAKDRKEVRP
jgi:hypothetical protein